MSGQA